MVLLILSKQKTNIFIEINPTGEWGWLSNDKREIDYDIAKKLSEAN